MGKRNLLQSHRAAMLLSTSYTTIVRKPNIVCTLRSYADHFMRSHGRTGTTSNAPSMIKGGLPPRREGTGIKARFGNAALGDAD